MAIKLTKESVGKRFKDKSGGELTVVGPHPYRKGIYLVCAPGGDVLLYKSDGAFCDDSNFWDRKFDLIEEIKPKVKLRGWVNVHRDGSCTVSDYPEAALMATRNTGMATINLEDYNIEVEEGQGL